MSLFTDDDIDMSLPPVKSPAPVAADDLGAFISEDDLVAAMPTVTVAVQGLTPAQQQQVAEALRDIDAVAAIEPVASLAPVADVLPADFPLPTLIRFVPNVALRSAAEQATAYALSIEVTGPEGLERADLAVAALRDSQKAILEHFKDPTEIALQLHRRLTGLRGDWTEPGEHAIRTVGTRIWSEQRRLKEIADAERRKRQEEEDAKARERAREDAAAAERNQAPKQVVEELQRRVETATAPPVPEPSVASVLKSTTTVTTWKSRPKGTPADAEPNPKIGAMTPAQLEQVRELLRAILENRAPMSAIEICYSTLNTRAKSDKSTFNIPGFEAYEDGGIRSKGTRRR